MTTVQDILDVAQHLSPVEQLEIIQSLSHTLRTQYAHAATEDAPLPRHRVLGLHAGAIWMSDDFDAPLPDSFWLGGDDEHTD